MWTTTKNHKTKVFQQKSAFRHVLKLDFFAFCFNKVKYLMSKARQKLKFLKYKKINENFYQISCCAFVKRHQKQKFTGVFLLPTHEFLTGKY